MRPWEQGKPARAGKLCVCTPVRPDAPPSQWLNGGNAAAHVSRCATCLFCVGVRRQFCMTALKAAAGARGTSFKSEALGGS